MENICVDLYHARSRIDRLEQANFSMTQCIDAIVKAQCLLEQRFIINQLVLDDLENSKRWNNVKISSIPESVSTSDLKVKVNAIINTYLGKPDTKDLELDNIQKNTGPPMINLTKTPDVLCQMYYYKERELLMRHAGERGTMDIEGMQITLLPALSQRTLFM